MFRPRTLKFLAAVLGLYGLLALPGLVWPSYAESPAGLLLLVPVLSIYLFHKAGVPGLLEHGGACGWGWCEPTPFGWLFLAAFWLAAAWLLAWTIASSTRRFAARTSSSEES
jgi:hypothetical protein